jgi:RNA polymerase sigma-70 factor (ECF subfamily)
VTDSAAQLHSASMVGVTPASTVDAGAISGAEPLAFEEVYRRYFPFIWRSVQSLGVPASMTDDVVQEVFVIAHQKLAAFEGRSALKTWLYGIALHRARRHRGRSRAGEQVDTSLAEGLGGPEAARPDRRAEHAEAARAVNAILDGLGDEQREVFVLAELEELTAPEIAEILGVPLNTVYSRLRLGREAFARGAARFRAQDDWRTR